ncbi:Hsp70 family protein [Gordonia rubripertincta]|uniref:Hsp70 family protein n=1 Tax=Gordonia rubripertincta TaxID=36822 RepID=UPI0015FB2864|nr:Hsp70 family protein [Gordonia rubripertincta]QMU21867.1 Hsp70 family protein [Gordonia rubripertincta]
MGITIGVKVGSANSVAVVASEHSWENSLSVETVGLVGSGDFLDRVGDPVPVLDDRGQSRPAAQIHAEAVAALLTRLDLTDPVEHLTVVHPDTWTSQAVAEAQAALRARGDVPTGEISWVSESRATLAAVEHSEGALGEGLVIGYDLGASALTVTVLATGDEPRVVSRPLRLDSVSGNEFDRLLLTHTLRVTGVDAEPADPGRASSVLDDLTRLRSECRRAKEALSVDTDAVVDVRVGETTTVARLVRDDVEDLVRAPIAESVALIREALASAGVDQAGGHPVPVTAIVLGGGGASIPLVTEMLSATLRVPVLFDPQPGSASAAGGALLGIAALGARASAALEPTTEIPGQALAPLPGERPMREIEPAPSTTVTTPAPRLSRRRRGILITAGAAALVLVSATGLSVGTGLVGSTGEATPPPAGAVTTTVDATPGKPGQPAPTVADAATGTRAADAGTRAAGTGTGTPARRQSTAPVPAGTPAPGTTSAPREGQAPSTGGQAPAPAAPPPAPAPVDTVPAPVPDQQPSPDVPEQPSTGGGGTPGGVLQVPGKILDGTGQVLCGVTRVVC